MNPESLARKTQTTQAMCCTVVGTASIPVSPIASRVLDVPTSLVLASGTASAVSGGWIFMAAASNDWRLPTKIVAVADGVSALGMAGLAVTRKTVLARIGLGVVAVSLGAFAASQGIALAIDRRSSHHDADE
jgi:hypothetical protein